MSKQRDEVRKQVNELIGKFKEKGATSPEKAMTPEELGLPPRFKESIQRRLDRTEIFVEVNGKYYLSEQRLKEVRERISIRRF